LALTNYASSACKDGEMDGHMLVQAFARHRIAHSDPRPVAECLREAAMDALGFDPNDFVEEARGHLADMPKCIQRDYLRLALEKIEAVTAALATHSPAPMAVKGGTWTVWDAEARMAREGDWRGVAYSIAHDILPLIPEGSPDHSYQERARMQIKAADRLVAAYAAAHPSTQEGGK